ncbi:hypothetical protein ALC60_03585 [Trachymyrmex zeteki]|uniref:Uncharacterized protein n=1 Tax=Mycetomoellerius zeteki TaxID=64791 RepID=A0A151XB60_9HYME|nr:hypothetical protein ALC60_03585 [Trachymyrmex zeteki]
MPSSQFPALGSTRRVHSSPCITRLYTSFPLRELARKGRRIRTCVYVYPRRGRCPDADVAGRAGSGDPCASRLHPAFSAKGPATDDGDQETAARISGHGKRERERERERTAEEEELSRSLRYLRRRTCVCIEPKEIEERSWLPYADEFLRTMYKGELGNFCRSTSQVLDLLSAHRCSAPEKTASSPWIFLPPLDSVDNKRGPS